MDTRFPEQPPTPETPGFSQQQAGHSRNAHLTKGGRTTLNGEELDHQIYNELKAGSKSETFTG